MSFQYILFLQLPEVLSLTRSNRKTQSRCMLLESGFFPKFLSSLMVGVLWSEKNSESSPLKRLKYVHLANIY